MKRQAFTLVELVVVILILGILAGVAAPRFLETSSDASEASVRQTLSVVRDAIELFTAQNNGQVPFAGGNPAAGETLALELAEYLRGGIPVCPVGPSNSSEVTVVNQVGTDGNPPAPLQGSAAPTVGWIYNRADGSFICAFDGPLPSNEAGETLGYDDI